MKNDAGKQSEQLSTAGEIFPDGTISELVHNPAAPGKPLLLHWKGETGQIGSSVAYDGKEYVPMELDHPGVAAALRLPAGVGPEEPPRKLFADIYGLLKEKLDQPKFSTLKLTLFILTSWVPEALPLSPLLWVTAAPVSARDPTRQLLALLCRRSLVLAGVRRADLSRICWNIHPTLILDAWKMQASLIELLRASSRPGINVAQNGGLLCPYGAKMVLSRELPGDLISDGDALFVVLTASPNRISLLDKKTEREIADKLQPRLLRFRLRNLAKLCAPNFDVSCFTPPAQELARALGAVVMGDEILESAILRLLTNEEKEHRLDRSKTIEAVLVEAILWFCHEQGQKKVRSSELAEKVNVIFAGRGSSETISPETVGWTLKGLGIPRRRVGSAGNGIELTDSTRRTVHLAALVLCAPGTLVGSGCKDCEELTNPDPPVGLSEAGQLGV